MRDELISSADDNEYAPESPILLHIQWRTQMKLQRFYELISIPNEVRQELTFSALDNEDIPESPTLLPV